MKYRVLIADDNAAYTLLCVGEILRDPEGIDIDTALTPSAALEKLHARPYDLVILDIEFGDKDADGLSLIPAIRSAFPGIGILMHSNSSEASTIIHARRLGADDFAAKGGCLQDLALRVRALLARKYDAEKYLNAAKTLASNVGAVFESDRMKRIFADLARLKDVSNLNILVRGPTGVGKELIAEALRRSGTGSPFVGVNCAAIPAQLMESELFGHTRGAFTGAIKDYKGKFEEADGGDIFLDEIACLSLPAQTALLRVLERKEIRRVGATETKKLSFRVIAATNENLEELVAQGKFREELLARLDGVTVTVPPLSERREDILPIAYKVLGDNGYGQLRIAKDCEAVLESLPWPKNVRQLKQSILAMATTASCDLITLADLPLTLLPEASETSSVGATCNGDKLILELSLKDISFESAKNELLRALIAAKMAAIGKEATQLAIARSLDIPRASLQRFLKRQCIVTGESQKKIVHGHLKQS